MRITLTPSGSEFSALAVGFWRLHEWNFSTKDLQHYIESCLELGITTFDHADIYGDYGNESLFGDLLKENPGLREKMEIVSKCGICLPTENRPENRIQHYNTTSEYIQKSAEQSLKNLHTDYLDLLLIHRPDPLMDVSEMADAFMKLIEEEKIRHIGVSNFTPSQFSLLQSRLNVPIVTNQVQCSLLHLDPIYDGTFDQAQQLERSPMLWSPFAGGSLFHSHDERAARVRECCHEIARKYNASIDQIALAWLLSLPCRPQPVLGSGKTDRIKQASEALEIDLGRQDWFTILQASQGHPVP